MDISIRDHEGRVAVFTDGICHDFFETLEAAEACVVELKKENAWVEFITDAIDDLRCNLMAAPYNLTGGEADRAIRDEVNF